MSMSDARKARLIGATALVLVGFVLLSWLLGSGDHAQKPSAAAAEEAVIVLPAKPLRTAKVGESESEPDPSAAESTEAEASQAEANPAPQPPKQQADRKDSPPPKPARTPSEPVSEPKPARAQATTSTGWYVQLGVFGSQANAQSLADKAREGDYRCELRKLPRGGNTLYRVLVGPYPSEAAAELRVPKLQRWLGETGRVVELQRDG